MNDNVWQEEINVLRDSVKAKLADVLFSLDAERNVYAFFYFIPFPRVAEAL